MRYFAELAYNGTNYSGWQRQPNNMTVQEQIETSMALIARQPVEIMGCGRTDSGVHASQYFIHFDFEGELPNAFMLRLNRVLPKDIAFRRIFEVASDAHTRFDAYSRSYEYHMDFRKNPFLQKTIYFYNLAEKPDFDKMQEAAALLLEYKEFGTFCKANHDAKTMICEMTRSEWEKIDEYHWVYHVTANRFLRGMVRLIVGMCLNVGRGKNTLEDVRKALDEQVQLKKSLSVNAEGLFLTNIKYPFLD